MSEVFFNYPGDSQASQTRELTFLPQWDNTVWAKLLSLTQVRRFRSGELVMRPGETDRTLYIIINGRLEVLIPRGDGGWRSTQIREVGTVIGEQSFLDGQPRSAALRALSDGEMVSISPEAFERFAAKEPELARDFLRELARTLSIKLRQANMVIAKWLK